MKTRIFQGILILVTGLLILGFSIQDKPPKTSVDYTGKMFIERLYNLTPLQLALSFLGEKEKFNDGTSNPRILSLYKDFADWVTDTEVAWCSAYMNSIYASTGYEYSGKLNARSWLDIGERVESPVPGDIVVFWRESPTSWKGHVGIYVNQNENNIMVLGGNQSNMVNISEYSKNRLLEYRRPRKLSELYDNSTAFMQQDTIVLDLMQSDTLITQ